MTIIIIGIITSDTADTADTSPITAMTKKKVVPKYPDSLSVQPFYSIYSLLCVPTLRQYSANTSIY